MSYLRRIIILAGVSSLLAALMLPLFFYVNIPCQDDWTLVPIVGKILNGHVTFMDFWAFRSEHRILFPRLVLCGWAALTRWDMSLIPWLNLALMLCSTLCIYRLSGGIQKMFWKDPIFWAASVFTFSIHAVKTAVWVIQFHTFLTVVLAVLAIGIASSAKAPLIGRWAAAIAVAIAATFSFGGGMVIWFAAIPLLIEIRKMNKGLTVAALWIGAAILSLFVYFQGFPYTENHPSIPFVLQDPIYTVRFFLNYLGALFYPLPSELFGALGLLLAAAMAVDLRQRKGLLCVVLFVMGNGLIISLLRSHYAIFGALVDRYIPLSCLLWASIAAWMTYRLSKPFMGAAVLLLIVCAFLIIPFHWNDHVENKKFLTESMGILRKDAPESEELQPLFSEIDLVRESIAILKKEKMSIFRQSF